jgi:hypothetical protein
MSGRHIFSPPLGDEKIFMVKSLRDYKKGI